MCDEIKEAIEQYLLSAPESGWVKSAVLCERFAVVERQLRGVGDKPGLCSEFAISGDKGFKHVELATKAEYRRFKHRMRKHAVGEFRRTSRLDKRRNSQTITIKRPAFTFQKDSGQGVLL
jgi:hypothetical protein